MNEVERQITLETNAVIEGVQRYKRALKSATVGASKAGPQFLRRYFTPLADAILSRQAEMRLLRKGAPLKIATPLSSLDAEELAVITLQCVCSMIGAQEPDQRKPHLTWVALGLGKSCRRQWFLNQIRASGLTRDKPDAAFWKRWSEAGWSAPDVDFHLGQALIDLAVDIGIFVITLEERKKKGKKGPRNLLGLSEPAKQWLKDVYQSQELLATPVYSPMIVKPVPWQGLQGGAYLTNKTTDDIQLVKHHDNRNIIEALSNANLDKVFTAVNAIQETPWRINSDIYSIMLEAAKSTLPQTLMKKLPEDVGHTILRSDQKEVCETLKRDVFYFPHFLDFRGRAYPIPRAIHPQHDDIARSLLEFAIGNPLGHQGVRWLQIHLANTFGKDKESFEDRMKWAEENDALIRDSSTKPLSGMRFWMNADKPWSFLAACIEWDRYKIAGPTLVSHLVVSVDGTCNGIQHLSALARDEVCGTLVNLIPNEGAEVKDIYQIVADLAAECVQRQAADGNVEARDWQENVMEAGRFDREIAKPATMTTPYGVTEEGMVFQLLGKELKRSFTNKLTNPKRGAEYLAKVLANCIAQVLGKANDVRNWLRDDVAKVLAGANKGIRWTSPIGFPLVIEERTFKMRRIRITRSGKPDLRFWIPNRDIPQQIDEEAQTDGIVAHLVQSLDAAHMMLTVNRLHAEGISSFAVVHDSYGVHACHVDRMNTVLREEFVSMYENDLLDLFITEQRRNSGIHLKPPPKRGDLDLSLVLNSPYFFC